MFIAIEGPDGSGKSTLAQEMTDRLLKEYPGQVKHFREPGDTALGEEVRRITKSTDIDISNPEMLLLFLAARMNLYRLEVAPALQQGKTVILDRCGISTVIYQAMSTSQTLEPKEWIHYRALQEKVNAIAQPDWCLNLAVDADVLQKRLEQRRIQSGDSVDRFEESLEFSEKIRQRYAEFVTIPAGRRSMAAVFGNQAKVIQNIHIKEQPVEEIAAHALSLVGFGIGE